MKNLLIIRHAKSSWLDVSQSDFDRPLNQRGSNDAPEMAKRLKEKNIGIDVFISSTANRAISTCRYFAEAYHVKEKNIITYPELYHASPEVFYDVLKKINDQYISAAVFSHNPGITAFVNELTNAKIDNMPTCGIFAVKIYTQSWLQFERAQKEFWFFDYPKLQP